MSWLHLLLFDLAWPVNEREDATSWLRRVIYRPLWSSIARRCGDYDPAREYDDA